MTDEQNKPAIFITGAGAGIGAATAQYFANQGWFVGLYDIDAKGLESTSQALPTGSYMTGLLDVTNTPAFTAALEAFFAQTQRLDVMFNNAGVLTVAPFSEMSLTEHHRQIDINVKALFSGCYLALPYLKQTLNSCVINMSSASSFYGTPDYASYSASKFAVRGITEALNIEWQPHCIRVADICPLFVDTPMVAAYKNTTTMHKLGIHLNANDIAKTVWRASQSKSNQVHWIVGLQTKATWFLQKIAPNWLTRFIVKLSAGY